MFKFNKTLFFLVIAVSFSIFANQSFAVGLGEACYISNDDGNLSDNCDTGFICDVKSDKCVKDTSTSPPPPAGNTGSPGGNVGANGRREDPAGRSGANGCTKEGDDFCPKDKFCYINGLCVPKPEAGIKEGSLRGAGSIFEVIAIVLKWLLTLAGVAATVFIIIGGYQYITAAGNEELSEKGKKTLVNAVIGLVIVVLAMTIITIITNTLTSTGPLG